MRKILIRFLFTTFVAIHPRFDNLSSMKKVEAQLSSQEGSVLNYNLETKNMNHIAILWSSFEIQHGETSS